MADGHLLSIDLGTTAVKVGLLSLSGKLVGLSEQEYILLTPGKELVELPVETYWSSILNGVQEVRRTSGVDLQSVLALSISSQGETLICVDNQGTPLRNAIVWLDARAEEEADELAQEFTQRALLEKTGYSQMAAVWPAPKILWLKRHEPETFAKTAKFLIVKDYIVWRLSGEYLTDPSVSASTIYFDIQKKEWWPEMLTAIGVNATQLPDVASSNDVAGTILPDAAAAMGLSNETKVVVGAMDQMAAALGAGNIGPGAVTESTGTALAVIATVNKPVFDLELQVPCCPHAVPDLFVLMPYSETSGILLKWFRETFPCSKSGNEEYSQLLSFAAKVDPGSDGLTALPHFTGTGFPDFNPHARGAFAGITLQHTRAHFVRSIVESVAFLLKDNIDLLVGLSVPVKAVRSLGGAARSDIWLQIKADVLNLPVEAPDCKDAASVGAAVLAGLGANIYSDFNDAVNRVVTSHRTFMPNTENSSIYGEAYEAYRSLYQRLYGR